MLNGEQSSSNVPRFTPTDENDRMPRLHTIDHDNTNGQDVHLGFEVNWSLKLDELNVMDVCDSTSLRMMAFSMSVTD